jgi:hypothetical protein
VLLAFVTVYFIHGSHFRLWQVVCVAESADCPPAVRQILDTWHGQLLLTLPYNKLKLQLLASFPLATAVELSPVLPQTLKVSFSVSSPVVALAPGPGLPLIILSDHVKVIAITTESPADIPVVNLSEIPKLQVGDYLPSPYHRLVEALLMLQSINLIYTHAVLLPTGSLSLSVPNKPKVILALDDQISRQVTSLQLILRSNTMLEEYGVIDLRFDKPVLRS